MVNFNLELKRQSARIKWIVGSSLDYDSLTKWEANFIESIEKQSDSGRWLSERQMEILESIYRSKRR